MSHRIPYRGVFLLAISMLWTSPAMGSAENGPEQDEFTTDLFIEDCNFSNRGRENRFFSLNPGDRLVLEGEEDGEIVGTEGAWRAGENGAQPGVIMPGTLLLGSRYFQEQAPGQALDAGENSGMGLAVDVPAGAFERCVEVTEVNFLEPADPHEADHVDGGGLGRTEQHRRGELLPPRRIEPRQQRSARLVRSAGVLPARARPSRGPDHADISTIQMYTQIHQQRLKSLYERFHPRA